MGHIFVGIDWGEDEHETCLMDPEGRVLAGRRISAGLPGVSSLHQLVAEHAEDPTEVVVGIEPVKFLCEESCTF